MNNKKIKIYSDSIEEKALEQFHSAMACDFAVKGALMPDAHTGYSLPIGAVVATNDVIVPAWVGFDVSCGVCAVRTTFKRSDIEANADAIFEDIYKEVPVGKGKFTEDQSGVDYLLDGLTDIGKEIADKRDAAKQLGTLGGGNHFIEIGYSDSDNETVWVIVHSGSRGLGHGIASHYMKLAEELSPAGSEHPYLVEGSKEFRDYLTDTNVLYQYALENRFRIASSAVGSMRKYCNGDALFRDSINRNHNHVEYRKGLWVHRKGATHAEAGMMGVIPGNMRDGSFIVIGLGNEDSLASSSHGAGRVLSRTKAKKTVDLAEFQDTMSLVKAKVDEKTLDESPMAYKNIFEVMDLQNDLVKVMYHVKPIVNIKG